MNLPDLKQIYQTINWHNDSQDQHGGGGVFIVLPSEIASQFPEEGREGEDESPSHITVLYVEGISHFSEKIKEAVCNVCSSVKPFRVKLRKPKKFVNGDKQTILHSPVGSSKLAKFHEMLKREFFRNHLPFSDKYPEFKPHVTIEYVNEGEKPQNKKLRPKGDWIVDSVWIWGGDEPYLIPLGK